MNMCCTHFPDKEGSNLYGIVELMLVKSGHSHAATHHLTPEELHLIASNLSTVFATFILLGAVVAGIYFYKKRRYSIIMQEMFQFMIDRKFYHLSFISLSLSCFKLMVTVLQIRAKSFPLALLVSKTTRLEMWR